MFKITTEWLEKHKTRNGGYTKLQLRQIGVPWPPGRGWKKAVVGAEIGDAIRAAFETGATA